jgi:TolB protein
VAFTSNRNGNYDVWVKDLTTGSERALTATREDEYAAVLSPDGSRVAFSFANSKWPIFVVPFSGGSVTQLCSECGEPRTWLPDSQGVLYQWLTPSGASAISVLRLSGETQTLVQSRESALYSPSVSPDGKWMAFIVRTPPNDHRAAVVLLHGETAAPPSDWIFVTESGPWINKPRWAPGGDLIYYVSNRDGFVCIWARQLDPATKQPIGEPKAIVHFHGVHNSLGSVYDAELSIAKDKLVFNLGEASGNIWLAPAAN